MVLLIYRRGNSSPERLSRLPRVHSRSEIKLRIQPEARTPSHHAWYASCRNIRWPMIHLVGISYETHMSSRSFSHSQFVSRLQKPFTYVSESATSLYRTSSHPTPPSASSSHDALIHFGIQRAIRLLCFLTSC